MGAAAITTSGFPIDRGRVADLLGFSAPKQNSYGCIASVDYITGLYSALKLPFLHLGRLVQDMGFWSAFEVGQLYVPDALVQVSSIMPQKRNPVPIEHMRHLASATVGRCDTILTTMHNTPFTDMNDSEGEVQAAGYAAFDSGARMVALLTAFLPACTINADRVRANADAACVTITELADSLVRTEGLSFRQAHEVASAVARAVIAEGKPLGARYATFTAAFQAETGRAPDMDDRAYTAAVSLQGFIAVRDRFGGPAPAPMEAALAEYDATLAGLRADLQTTRARRDDANARLTDAFFKLMEPA